MFNWSLEGLVGQNKVMVIFNQIIIEIFFELDERYRFKDLKVE